jgi:hypothetical protein
VPLAQGKSDLTAPDLTAALAAGLIRVKDRTADLGQSADRNTDKEPLK